MKVAAGEHHTCRTPITHKPTPACKLAQRLSSTWSAPAPAHSRRHGRWLASAWLEGEGRAAWRAASSL
eukprot:11841290-Alexandrium_andersonii.AAC.1